MRLQNGEIHALSNDTHVAFVDGGFTARTAGVRSIAGVGNDLWLGTSTGFTLIRNGVPTPIASTANSIVTSRDGGVWALAPEGPFVFVGGGFVPVPQPPSCTLFTAVAALGLTAVMGCSDIAANTTSFYELSPLAVARFIVTIDAGTLHAAGSDDSNLHLMGSQVLRRFFVDGGTAPSPFVAQGYLSTPRVSTDGQLLLTDTAPGGASTGFRFMGEFWQAVSPASVDFNAFDMIGDAWAASGLKLRSGATVPSFGQALTTSQTTPALTAARLFRRPDGGVAMLHDNRIYSVSASGVRLETTYTGLANGPVTALADGRTIIASTSGTQVLNADGTIIPFPGASRVFALADNRFVAVGNTAQRRLVRLIATDGGVVTFDGGAEWTWVAARNPSASSVTLMAIDQLADLNLQTGVVTPRSTPNSNSMSALCVDEGNIHVTAGGQLFSSRDGGAWMMGPLSGSSPVACAFGSIAQADSWFVSATNPTRRATFTATSVEFESGGVVFAAGGAGEVVRLR